MIGSPCLALQVRYRLDPRITPAAVPVFRVPGVYRAHNNNSRARPVAFLFPPVVNSRSKSRLRIRRSASPDRVILSDTNLPRPRARVHREPRRNCDLPCRARLVLDPRRRVRVPGRRLRLLLPNRWPARDPRKVPSRR